MSNPGGIPHFNPMTPDQMAEAMQKICDEYGWDEQRVHVKMDNLLLSVLSELGYTKAVEIFRNQDKWYA